MELVEEKTSQAGKTVSKAVSKAFNQAVKSINSALDQISKTMDAISNAFVFETEVGFGLGAHTGIGSFEVGVSVSKIMGYGYSNNQSYQYTSSYIGGDISINNYKAGLSIDVRNYDNGMGNPMVMPWEIWNDENTVKDITLFFNRKITGNLDYSAEKTKNSRFIGVSFEEFCGISGKIKIGFNI